MSLPIIGDIIDFGKGVFNYFQQEKKMDQDAALARENMAQQREFAQHGIRWKVEDAKAAGLHPLAALGATTTSFSPVSVGDSSAPSLDLGNMGQGIDRAIAATQTTEEKADAYTNKLQALQLERGELENSLLKTQIMKANQPAARQPSMPSANPQYGVDGQAPTQQMSASGFPVSVDKMEQKPDQTPKHARGNPFGIPLLHNPWVADGEDIETRYGDIGEKFAIANLPLDVAYTVWKRMLEHRVPTDFKGRWPAQHEQFRRR